MKNKKAIKKLKEKVEFLEETVKALAGLVLPAEPTQEVQPVPPKSEPTPEELANNEDFQFLSAPGPWSHESVQAMLDEYNEQGRKENLIYSAAMVGSAEKPANGMTLHIIRGKPDGSWADNPNIVDDSPDSLRAEYETVRDVLKMGLEANPPYYPATPGFDIGPIEEAYFVLADDCQSLDPPMQPIEPEEQWKGPYYDEWNVLMNKSQTPAYYKEIWDRRKITFQQLYDKVKTMPTGEQSGAYQGYSPPYEGTT